MHIFTVNTNLIMRKNLLQQALDYEETKGTYNNSDREVLKKSLIRSMDQKLSKLGNVFIDTIDESQ